MKNSFSRQVIYTLVVFFIVLIMIVGVSYAYVIDDKEIRNINNIHLRLQDNNKLLTNLTPISDDIGINQLDINTLDFEIDSSIQNENIYYDINLKGNTNIEQSKIKVYLAELPFKNAPVDMEKVIIGPKHISKLLISNIDDNSLVITKIKPPVSNGVTKYYRLKLWVSLVDSNGMDTILTTKENNFDMTLSVKSYKD